MLARIDWGWRWLGTAFSFLLFGIGGVFLSLVVFPLLRLIPGSSEKRQRRAKKVVHRTFLFYIRLMRFLGVLSYRTENLEALKGARLVLANHPSLLDVVFLIALIPNANCVVKGRLLRHIWTRGPIMQAGYILNHDQEDVIEQANRAMARGDTLIVFPEGTRTQPGEPLALRRGASQVAVRCNTDITPVIIHCAPTTLTKQDRWYQVPRSRVRFQISVKPLIPVAPFVENTVASRAARSLTRHLTEYFNQEVSLHEQSAPGTQKNDYRRAGSGGYNA
ncbi:lysophospholipid acyltransferase family protein [Marinobacterium lutimaris]|nr:lysophospholipid acyltransferase family protein [Marinobacterium lutimaris]